MRSFAIFPNGEVCCIHHARAFDIMYPALGTKPVLNLSALFRCAGPPILYVVVVDFKDPIVGDLLFVSWEATRWVEDVACVTTSHPVLNLRVWQWANPIIAFMWWYLLLNILLCVIANEFFFHLVIKYYSSQILNHHYDDRVVLWLTWRTLANNVTWLTIRNPQVRVRIQPSDSLFIPGMHPKIGCPLLCAFDQSLGMRPTCNFKWTF